VPLLKAVESDPGTVVGLTKYMGLYPEIVPTFKQVAGKDPNTVVLLLKAVEKNPHVVVNLLMTVETDSQALAIRIILKTLEYDLQAFAHFLEVVKTKSDYFGSFLELLQKNHQVNATFFLQAVLKHPDVVAILWDPRANVDLQAFVNILEVVKTNVQDFASFLELLQKDHQVNATLFLQVVTKHPDVVAILLDPQANVATVLQTALKHPKVVAIFMEALTTDPQFSTTLVQFVVMFPRVVVPFVYGMTMYPQVNMAILLEVVVKHYQPLQSFLGLILEKDREADNAMSV